MPEIVIILNGTNRYLRRFYRNILPPLQAVGHVQVLETKYPRHAVELANQYKEKCEYLLAAGGDGTLHEVTNGLLQEPSDKLPVVGVIPLGSGNDFSRTMGLEANGEQLAQLIQTRSTMAIDVGFIQATTVQGNPVQEYFINVCSVGMGPDVLKRLSKRPRWLGAGFSYFTSILESFFSFVPVPINASGQEFNYSGHVRVMAFANGKSFGNKLTIAPEAKVNDGWLNVFVAGNATILDFIRQQSELKNGKIIQHPLVSYHTCKEVTLTSLMEAGMEADGEFVGFLPASVSIQKNRLNFLYGIK